MEALGVNLKFLLIQLANFGLFVFLFTKFLLKPILKVLDERKRKIAEGLEAAEMSKDELMKIDVMKTEAKKKAKAEEKKLLDEAKIKAEKESNQIVAMAKKQAEKIVHDATASVSGIKNEEDKKNHEQELRVIEKVIEKMMNKELESVDVRARYQKVMSELYQTV